MENRAEEKSRERKKNNIIIHRMEESKAEMRINREMIRKQYNR